MPSTITHAYMAMDIFQRLSKKNILDKDKLNEYITYSEGPDILFFYRIFFPFKKSLKIQNLGNRVHREKTNQFFISLVQQIKKSQDKDQFLFLSGLVTHYVGDTTCHPLVNYKEKEMRIKTQKNKDYHFLIESYIDNYILDMKRINYKKFPCYQFFSINSCDAIKKLLDKSFTKVFYQDNMGKIYYDSLKNMKFFIRFVRYDPFKVKRILYAIISLNGRIFKRDLRYLSSNFNLTKEESIFYLNLNQKKWYNIRKKDNISNKSFLDLYDEVIIKSEKRIKKLYNYIYRDKFVDLEKLFGNLSYVSGLPLKDK